MVKRLDNDIQILNDFLQVKTPEAWLQYAAQHVSLLLIDHAHCERKAATTAINFISKYPDKTELVNVMSPLAREELLHFEKVMDLIRLNNLAFGPLVPSDYGSKLHKLVTTQNNQQRLSDLLITGAIIEARSCERFHSLIPYLEDQDLAKFYATLVRSEARHFLDYLRLAKLYGDSTVDSRIAKFLAIENEIITSVDTVFRFHSGIPLLEN